MILRKKMGKEIIIGSALAVIAAARMINNRRAIINTKKKKANNCISCGEDNDRLEHILRNITKKQVDILAQTFGIGQTYFDKNNYNHQYFKSNGKMHVDATIENIFGFVNDNLKMNLLKLDVDKEYIPKCKVCKITYQNDIKIEECSDGKTYYTKCKKLKTHSECVDCKKNEDGEIICPDF